MTTAQDYIADARDALDDERWPPLGRLRVAIQRTLKAIEALQPEAAPGASEHVLGRSLHAWLRDPGSPPSVTPRSVTLEPIADFWRCTLKSLQGSCTGDGSTVPMAIERALERALVAPLVGKGKT